MTDLLVRWGRFGLTFAGVLGLVITCRASAAVAEATSGGGMVGAAGGSAGQQLWVSSFSGPEIAVATAFATAVAASPAGGAVFVAGEDSSPDMTHSEFVTIGYNAATGARLWVSQFDGAARKDSEAHAVTVSPDGSRVFVTGQTLDAQGEPEYATVAYAASTGARLWDSLQAAHGTHGAAVAQAMVISPDGKVVYVTGYSGYAGGGGVYDYVTIAYDAATGKALWSVRYDNGGNDQGRAIAISPSGRVVYVTGRSFAKKTGYDDATIAYNAATGKKLWVARYTGKTSKNKWANAIAVSPDGKAVYITGGTHGKTSRQDFATVGYNAVTGRQLWARSYNGPGNGNDAGAALAVSPNSATVVVTGLSTGTDGPYDIEWATIAYNARTGAARWTKRHGVISEGSPAENIPEAVVMNPRGGTVYVTGAVAIYEAESFDGTVAYSVSTGARKWAKIYTDEDGSSYAAAAAISPDGHTLYVTGSAATIAYRA